MPSLVSCARAHVQSGTRRPSNCWVNPPNRNRRLVRMGRNDGTTGLIVGGMAGGVLGSIIAPGGSKTVGAILGAVRVH